VARKGLKRLYKTKTSLAKAKTLLPSENVALKGEKTLLPSETVTLKAENAFTETKRLTFKPITGLPSEDARLSCFRYMDASSPVTMRFRTVNAFLSFQTFTVRKRLLTGEDASI